MLSSTVLEVGGGRREKYDMALMKMAACTTTAQSSSSFSSYKAPLPRHCHHSTSANIVDQNIVVE